MSDRAVTMTVNGRERTATVPDRTSLADMLRDNLRLTGTHLGCEQGVCGACTVMLDGLPVRACLTLAVACDGAEVTTIEGLHGPDIDRLRAAFSTFGGLQCGFCTPGMLMSCHELVMRRQEMSREELAEEMTGNVCRCTGYNGILKALQSAVVDGIAAEAEGADPDTDTDTDTDTDADASDGGTVERRRKTWEDMLRPVD